jgi:four helix bundle protein
MSKISSFEDLIVWRKSIGLSVEVYKITSKFPKDEIFGLTAQIRRASNSVSLNIAEGSVKSTATFINQLTHANGSANEVLSGSILAVELGFMGAEELNKVRLIISEVTKMLNSLISTLNKRKN